MPIWNEELQQWGYHFYENHEEFTWLGIPRKKIMPIDKPYGYHKPSAEGLDKINQLRRHFTEGERLIKEVCPVSRHQSVAITQNETTAMWAIKAVVFNDPDSEVSTEE